MRPVVLTIAGSDPTGGAGIQADVKTFQAFGVHGASVVTTVTAQATTGVRGRHDVPPAFVGDQLDAILDDLPVAVVKTGLLPDPRMVEVVATRLRARLHLPLVVDPVLVSTAGDVLTDPDTLAAIRDRLVPLASLVTPNLDEAAALLGRRVDSVAAMSEAATGLLALGAHAALVKGGHLATCACDVLATPGGLEELEAPRIPVGPVHGTGCTLAAAIAAGLARGHGLSDAVRIARDYVRRAIAASQPIGRGSRLLDHAIVPHER